MRKILSYLILLAVVNSCKTDYAISEKKSGYTEVKTQEKDANIEKMIVPYRDSLTRNMEVIIGKSELEMKTGQPESLLGNFVCDLILEYNQSLKKLNDRQYYPTLVLMNYRGLRAPLPKGDITVKHVYEIMPFENSLVYLNIKGTTLMEMAKFLVGYGGQPISSNFRISADGDKLTTVTLNGNSIDSSATYTVITSDYLATGGDNMSFFTQATSKMETNYKIRDLLLDQIKNNTKNTNPNTATIDGRFTIK